MRALIMIIAQISDTHLELDTPEGEQRHRDFVTTIKDINTLDPAPDVIVHSGDIVHNGHREEYAEAQAILSTARAPVFVLAGNKDNRANLHTAFAGNGYLTSSPAFIDYGIEEFPVRLIALDTLSARSNRGDFCAERAERLNILLNSESSRPVALFTHHPPFEVTEGPDAHHFETRDMAMRLRDGIRQCDRIVAIFSGHVHRAVRGTVGGIRATTMTSIATNLRKGDYPDDMKSRPVYHLHQFDPEVGFITRSRIV